ncbi:GNAT family N-acetyltransferase [Streptomyces regalis]|nr:GNAT family N-acetyltransferase [Streptomyces regalis]
MGPSVWWNGPVAPSARTPTEIVLFDHDDHLIGRLRFRVCPTCRTGRILEIWVYDAWQRQGLGRELVHSLLARRPGYRWSTTLQTRAGRVFFLAMAQETTVALPHGRPLCRHLMGSIRRTWRGLLDHWPPSRRPGAQ